MAALWEEFEDEQEETHHTCSIITKAADVQVKPVNERMPVLLDDANSKLWLNSESSENDLLNMLAKPTVFPLESFTVCPRINSLELNEATMMLPSAPADQHGNLTLFD